MWAMVSATAQLLVSFALVASNAKAANSDVPLLLLRKNYPLSKTHTVLGRVVDKCFCKNARKMDAIESPSLKTIKLSYQGRSQGFIGGASWVPYKFVKKFFVKILNR